MSQNSKSHRLDLVRRLNASLILTTLRTSSPQSRADLAKLTGLGRTTVSSLTDELLERNMITELGLQPSSGGRPGIKLGLNPEGGCAFGLEINTDFLLAVMTDFVSEVRWRKRVQVDARSPGKFIFAAEALLAEALEYNERVEKLEPLGIGVGVLGLVHETTGELKLAPNLHWHNLPLQSMWQSRFNMPVYVKNEATASALGEYYYGQAKDYSYFIYIDATAMGVGAGIILNDSLFKGSAGFAGEVGHMVIDPQGRACACGNQGCWEAQVSCDALVEELYRQLESGRTSSIFGLLPSGSDDISLEIISQAARSGDEVARDVLLHASRVMGHGIANLINIFNPQLIVLGGLLSHVISPYLPVLQETVNERILTPMVSGTEIRLSSMGTDACVMGTIAVVLDEILRVPIPVT